MNYVQNIENELKARGITAKKMLLDLGYSDNLISQWKKGNKPSADRVLAISDYLDVSIDYLMSNSDKQRKNLLLKIKNVKISTPKRAISLRGGKITEKDTDLLNRVAEYVGCPMLYLTGFKCDYNPPKRKLEDLDGKQLFKIYDILDRYAVTELHEIVQLQLSRIINYHLRKKGITDKMIQERCKFHPATLKYIADGTKNIDPTLNYGYNFSDFVRIIEEFEEEYGITPEYLLTGVEEQEGK